MPRPTRLLAATKLGRLHLSLLSVRWRNPFLSLMGHDQKLAKSEQSLPNPFENSVADGFWAALHQR